jgi:hypothetical protein
VSQFDQDEGEVVDGLPVIADPQVLQPRRRALVPVRQVAALAATGFVAGAATVAVVTRRRARVTRRRRKKLPVGKVVASNSFLIDVHLIKRD